MPGQWIFDPDGGGVKIKEAVKKRTREHILRYAETHFAGRYTQLDIRFRGQFCYVDAYTEPEPPTRTGRRQVGQRAAKST